ncbi:MAG TPA: pyridoxal phosphate-dependent aminotransferase [Desulfobacteraceae bacterium]|nr:pyridoxal phosphate-dependent aminotransferase [Desulfobacteraceae bacterium]
MRTEIVHIGAGELNYEIRNIIRVVDKLKALGAEINLENIGDPVAKGEEVPVWIKKIVSDISMEDCAYSYCPSQGILETREYLAERNNRLGGAAITADDIIFFNGLGDAITKVYGFLRRTARIITPSPTYTTHSSSEAAHAGVSPVTYPLDPHHHWYPDTAELRKRVKYNPAVAGILLINPDNPTGAVYPEEILREIVQIAKDYDLFIIADEIYQNLVFDGVQTRTLAEVIGEVPGIAMKGISKELPWPGSRCGWIEIYNRERDPDFKTYTQSILNAKMVEVCSTTLPQKVIPLIFEHPEHEVYVGRRKARYQRMSETAFNTLKEIPSILINRTNGAFYMSVLFREDVLTQRQTLPIENHQIRALIESLLQSNGNISLDKRFVYYLLAATGVCVVPLSSFNTDLQGFRFTLLDPDEDSFFRMVNTLAEGVKAYV